MSNNGRVGCCGFGAYEGALFDRHVRMDSVLSNRTSPCGKDRNDTRPHNSPNFNDDRLKHQTGSKKSARVHRSHRATQPLRTRTLPRVVAEAVGPLGRRQDQPEQLRSTWDGRVGEALQHHAAYGQESRIEPIQQPYGGSNEAGRPSVGERPWFYFDSTDLFRAVSGQPGR